MKAGIHPREARLAEKQRLDGALTEARTALAKLRCERDAITIGLRKGELIRRYDAKLRLGFLLTGMRQRLMSFSYSLAPRLAGRTEHEISRLLDEEVRLALRDIATWPSRMADPDWSENIDEDLRPPPENVGNGDGVDGGAARQERKNSRRRAAYAAKSKEA
jgi:hypothetical protein